jgi:hypothetical protein
VPDALTKKSPETGQNGPISDDPISDLTIIALFDPTSKYTLSILII